MQTQLKDKQAKEDKQRQDSEECFEYVKQDANERKILPPKALPLE